MSDIALMERWEDTLYEYSRVITPSSFKQIFKKSLILSTAASLSSSIGDAFIKLMIANVLLKSDIVEYETRPLRAGPEGEFDSTLSSSLMADEDINALLISVMSSSSLFATMTRGKKFNEGDWRSTWYAASVGSNNKITSSVVKSMFRRLSDEFEKCFDGEKLADTITTDELMILLAYIASGKTSTDGGLGEDSNLEMYNKFLVDVYRLSGISG